MNAHFKLLAGILINKSRAVYRVFFNVYGERDGADDFGVVACSGINNLLNGRVKNPMFVSAYADS